MDTIDFTKLKIGTIINKASGGCDASSEGKMREIFAAANITDPQIWAGGSEDMKAAFAEANAASLDVLIILGGDGTIRSGAAICTPAGPFLVPLPGGTLNILSKALYGNRPWEELLATILEKSTVKSVSGGTVSGHEFFITAILGSPALWAKAREALRIGDVTQALNKSIIAFQGMFFTKIRYSFSSKESGAAEAILVTCPLISDTISDTEKSFEAAVLDIQNGTELLTFASSAAFATWKENEHVTLVKTKSVTVTSERDIPVIIDGEPIESGNEVTVTFIPEAFKALVPVLTA